MESKNPTALREKFRQDDYVIQTVTFVNISQETMALLMPEIKERITSSKINYSASQKTSEIFTITGKACLRKTNPETAYERKMAH